MHLFGGLSKNPHDGGWHYLAKAMMHPRGIIEFSRRAGADHLVFAENEPLLSFEFTLDTARLAKAAGLQVVLYTNGFSAPAVIETIGRYVDAVDLGIKGSLDPVFYDRWMKAPGAVAPVQAALQAWKRQGVHLVISDLIATPVMQTADVFATAATRLYTWIGEHLGPHTPVLHGAMHTPDNISPAEPFLVKKTEAHYAEYLARFHAAHTLALDAGLPYAHMALRPFQIDCHACGGVLLKMLDPDCGLEAACKLHRTYCRCWDHVQHVTATADDRGGTCDHCGAAVPLVPLSPARVRAIRHQVPAVPGA